MPSSTTPPSPTTTSDASVLLQEVLPAFMAAIQAVSEGRQEADDAARTLLPQLEKRRDEAPDEESRALWTAAVTLVQKVLVERPGPVPLIDHVQELEDHPGDGWKVLCAMCYLGASVDQHTTPRLAAAFHMTMAEYLFTETRQTPELYETVILPWFAAYWTRVFENARFRFSTPRVIETELKAALESAPELQLQRLLGTVGFGLDIALPDEGQEWFKV